MSKFIRNNQRQGTCYLEFQFCETDNPIKDGKARCDKITHWQDDSIYMDWDDFNDFFELYNDLFGCAVFPNGGCGCDSCGVNYYGKSETEMIAERIAPRIKSCYEELLPWLNAAKENGRGFYILGV